MNYVIGDSHVSIFSGQDGLNLPDLLPNFRTHNISARLAYNFGKNDHPVTIAVDKALKDIPVGSPVIFSFGEIDCRCHVWKHVAGNLDAVVDDIASRYTKRLGQYMAKGFDVYALLPHAIKYKPDGDIESAAGTWAQITAASKLFNGRRLRRPASCLIGPWKSGTRTGAFRCLTGRMITRCTCGQNTI